MESAEASTSTVPPLPGRLIVLPIGCPSTAKTDHGTATEECISSTHIFAPVIVIEFLIVGDMNVGAINAYRDIATHLIRPTNERQFIAAVEIAVVLKMSIHGISEVLDSVNTSGGNERRRFTIWIRNVWQNDGAALRVACIRPVRKRDLHISTEFGFPRTIRTPRCDLFL